MYSKDALAGGSWGLHTECFDEIPTSSYISGEEDEIPATPPTHPIRNAAKAEGQARCHVFKVSELAGRPREPEGAAKQDGPREPSVPPAGRLKGTAARPSSPPSDRTTKTDLF